MQSFLHPLVITLSPDCDLERDYDMRFEVMVGSDDKQSVPIEAHPNAMSHALLCSLLTRDELRPRFTGDKEGWRRISSNQDERYHHLEAAPVDPTVYVHECFMDFKKVFSVPIDRLYDGVFSGEVERIAVLPGYYVHDLIHRFYAFLSRVAIP